MLYLYLDESGDLGFDFINKKPSKYFTITTLAINGSAENKKLLKAVKLTLRRKFSHDKKAIELKGSKCPFKIKEYFYKQVNSFDFSIYSLTLNKIRVYERLRKDKERVYNFICRQVFDHIPFANASSRVEIIIDKSKTKKNIAQFNKYILKQIKTRFDPKIPLDIYHKDSVHHYGLQAVDLFCWGIFQKYEHKDMVWYSIYKDKIILDRQYL